MTSRLGNIEAGVRMTDQQPLVGVQIGPDFSPDIWTDLESAPRGTRDRHDRTLTDEMKVPDQQTHTEQRTTQLTL